MSISKLGAVARAAYYEAQRAERYSSEWDAVADAVKSALRESGEWSCRSCGAEWTPIVPTRCPICDGDNLREPSP